MSQWKLSQLFKSLHEDIRQELEIARMSFNHPGTKGDVSEKVWRKLFKTYLPKRYRVASAHIVDSKERFSDQIDVVIFDRQYSPFIFCYEGKKIIPAESVYAVFEVKQAINSTNIGYTKRKIGSVRQLTRTNLPVPHVGGIQQPRPLFSILGGILTFESDWKPKLGRPLIESLDNSSDNKLDCGCIAEKGYFFLDSESTSYTIKDSEKSATEFLFWLISQLQSRATVPMIDIQAYTKWL